MDCKQAQFLMALFIANDPDLTGQQHTAFQEHLKSCPECAREYEESKFAIELAKQYWPITDETAVAIEKSSRIYKPKMTIEEGWKDLCRRCPELAESTKKPKSLQVFLRIGAIAACLVIGVLTWMVCTNHSKQQTLPQNIVSPEIVTAPKPSVKVELVKPAGNIAINSGQAIVANKELKTLLINGKHRMVMNTGTVLTIEPIVEQSIGCLVKLDSGQIYTRVQHDGNPFIIDTDNGQAVITGTTFDIKATKDSTTLVVSEGTVRFESEKGIVNVAAGQSSKITGRSTPSIPLSCNTYELTAWATGYKRNTELAQAELDDVNWYLALPLKKDPIILAETDYNYWIENKRDWFKQEFPWIFQLKNALYKEGIESDYPELLIKTEDVWQFVCFDSVPVRFSAIDPNSLAKVASNYGFDKQWLLENVSAAKSASENPTLLENSFTGLKALERWIEYLDRTKEPKPPTPIYSYHASKYLTETRSLIWFAVRNGKYDLTDKECFEVLALLQEEIKAAYICQNAVLFPPNEKSLSCGEEKRQVSIINYVIASVSIIYECEKTLVEYISPLLSTTK